LVELRRVGADYQYAELDSDSGGLVASPVVSYQVDAGTVVRIEVESSDDFRPVAAEQIVGNVREAVRPAVEAARVVLERVGELRPAQVEVKFGVKVNGTANWLVAKVASEANFEITLTWRPGADGGEDEAKEE
jgi:hypothetical protein